MQFRLVAEFNQLLMGFHKFCRIKFVCPFTKKLPLFSDPFASKLWFSYYILICLHKTTLNSLFSLFLQISASSCLNSPNFLLILSLPQCSAEVQKLFPNSAIHSNISGIFFGSKTERHHQSHCLNTSFLNIGRNLKKKASTNLTNSRFQRNQTSHLAGGRGLKTSGGRSDRGKCPQGIFSRGRGWRDWF